MKNRNQNELEDNFIEQKLAETFEYGDEQLEDELDRAVAAAKEEGYRAPRGELEKIIDLLEYRRASRHKVVRVRRVVKTLIAAAILGAMVVGSGMWVGAKRYYVQEVRDKENLPDVMVFNNSEDNLVDDSEVGRAYAEIESQFDFAILELSYLPKGMVFKELIMTKRKGVMVFEDGNNELFLTQGFNNKPGSLGMMSDGVEQGKIYCSILDKEIPIYQEVLENGKKGFGIRVIEGNNYYLLEGTVDIEEFSWIVNGMKWYEFSN